MNTHVALPAAKSLQYAQIFAALGDPTRVTLVSQLSSGTACSISQLTDSACISRQAVTKHLQILERAGLVQNTRHGRESLFELVDKPFNDIHEYLNLVSVQWEQALSRLKSFVEE